MQDINQLEYRRYLEEISNELEFSYKRKNRIKLILRLYSFVGILTSVLAIIYFAISYYGYNLTSPQRFALMLAGIGLLLSLLSKFYSEIIKEQEKEREARRIELNKISQFVLDWATLERTIYSILERNESNISKYGIKRNIRLLYDEQIISDREFIELERALDHRNKIVHGHTPATSEELDRYSEQINEVIDKVLVWTKGKH